MSEQKKFLAGFGMTDITPEDSVPMTSYGDDLRRFSEGRFTDLEARAVAVTGTNGESLIFVTGDLTWCPGYLGKDIKAIIEQETGVSGDHVFLSGTHTHGSVGCHHDHVPAVMKYREKYIAGMAKAACLAFENRKPAEIYVGSAITERMNFVRRYIMDDGSMCGDNAYGTGERVVAHESQADPEFQLMKLVREDDKDILVANFQCHPHLEGKTKMLSAQLAGNFRDEAEARWDVNCLYWNGAAGNINSHSRIKQETRTKDPKEWASIMADYAAAALPRLVKVQAGPVKVAYTNLSAKTNHQYDDVVEQAKLVVKYFREEGHTAQEAAQYAWSLNCGINSYYHAGRIVSNAEAPETKDIFLQTYSFGDVAGVVLPYEMFDTTLMYVKRNSPFRKTFVTGYSWPSYTGYIPSSLGFANHGYEADNCAFAPGTAEQIADTFLDLLHSMND